MTVVNYQNDCFNENKNVIYLSETKSIYMKKFLLFTAASFLAVSSFGQTQIGNGDMENWANDDEPDNWNSFTTASGTWSSFAGDQCDESNDVRPGSTGTSSCKIWSNSVLGTIANGNVTLGRIEMGSTTPTSPDNYNYSITADGEFSEALTDTPDSIVFWVRFELGGGTAGNARMKATLHTDYDYRDPEDAAAAAEVVATAVENFPPTGGNWERHSVPFVYSGPASVNEYILVTFTTNETGGQGNDNDQLWIDDVELIYNPAGAVDTDGDGVLDATESTDGTDPNDMCSFILSSVTEVPSAAWVAADCDGDGVTNGDEVLAGTDPLVTIDELSNDGIIVSMNNQLNVITVSSPSELDGGYTVYNAMGQAIQSGDVEAEIPFTEVVGVYFVHIAANNKTYKFEILKN